MENRGGSYHLPLTRDTWVSRRLQGLLDTRHQKTIPVIDPIQVRPQTVEHILKALSLVCHKRQPERTEKTTQQQKELEKQQKTKKYRKQLQKHQKYNGFDMSTASCTAEEVRELHEYLYILALSPAVYLKRTVLSLSTVQDLLRYMTREIPPHTVVLHVKKAPTLLLLPTGSPLIAALQLQVTNHPTYTVVVGYIFKYQEFMKHESSHVGSLVETLQHWQQMLL